MAISGSEHAEDLVSLLRSGEVTWEVRRFAAEGLLPLDAADRLRALLAVLPDPDPDIAATARGTFDGIAPDTLVDFLRDSAVTPSEIEAISSRTDDMIVLERIVRHRNVADSTLAALARTVTGSPQEALIVNQARLLGNPSLIDALFENPDLTADGRRMLNELKEEFFFKEARRREGRRASKEKTPEPEMEGPAESPEESEGPDEPEETAQQPDQPIPESERARGAEELYLRIMRMSVPERVKLALTGGREERRFLIGDSNKIVGLAVLRSRGLTVTEVEGFCQMRHLDHDIFWKIASKRDWIRRPSIALTLVKNPKVPFPISLPLVRHLPMRELRNIFRDRNLPEAVRATARKTYMQRRK